MSAAKKVFWTQFFCQYAAAGLAGDPAKIMPFYAKGFIAAGPAGSAVHHHDDAFRAWLTKVHAGNQEAGMTEMDVLGIEEACIGDDYTLITVEWGARFQRTGAEVISFRIAYLLELHGQAPQILAFISHDDQDEVMKEKGLA